MVCSLWRCHMLRLYVFAISASLAIWSASRTYCRARIKGLGFRVHLAYTAVRESRV